MPILMGIHFFKIPGNTFLMQETENRLAIAAILFTLFLTLLVNFNGTVWAQEDCVWTPDDPCAPASDDIDPPDFNIPPSPEWRGVTPPPEPGTTGSGVTPPPEPGTTGSGVTSPSPPGTGGATSPAPPTTTGGVTQFFNWINFANNKSGTSYSYPPTWKITSNNDNGSSLQPLNAIDTDKVAIIFNKIEEPWSKGLFEIANTLSARDYVGRPGPLLGSSQVHVPAQMYGPRDPGERFPEGLRVDYGVTDKGEGIYISEILTRREYSPFVNVFKVVFSSPELFNKYNNEVYQIFNTVHYTD